MVGVCMPRGDGEPILSALRSDDDYADPQARCYWAIELEGVTSITQEYVRNTPILRTRQMDDQGNIVETLDFCPRFKRQGSIYRPVAFVRVVRPVAGSPRIRVRLRPITACGQGQPDVRYVSNPIRLPLSPTAMRLSTGAPHGLYASA